MEENRRAKPLTRDEVAAAIGKLQAKGEPVAPTRLYKELGGRGSFSTIGRYLEEWDRGELQVVAADPAIPEVGKVPTLPDDVRQQVLHAFEIAAQSVGQSIWGQLYRSVLAAEIASEVAELEAEVDRLRHQADDRDRLVAELQLYQSQLIEVRSTAEVRLAELATATAQRQAAESQTAELLATARALRAELEAALIAKGDLERRLQRQEEALSAAALALAGKLQAQ